MAEILNEEASHPLLDVILRNLVKEGTVSFRDTCFHYKLIASSKLLWYMFDSLCYQNLVASTRTMSRIVLCGQTLKYMTYFCFVTTSEK